MCCSPGLHLNTDLRHEFRRQPRRSAMSNLANCRDCNVEVSASARSCPKCGAKNPASSHRKIRIRFWVGVGSIALLLLFGLFRYESFEGPRWEFVELRTGVSRSGQLRQCIRRYVRGAPFAQRPGQTPMQTMRVLCDAELDENYHYQAIASRFGESVIFDFSK